MVARGYLLWFIMYDVILRPTEYQGERIISRKDTFSVAKPDATGFSAGAAVIWRWDGMAAAYGKLLVCCKDGSVVAFGSRHQ